MGPTEFHMHHFKDEPVLVSTFSNLLLIKGAEFFFVVYLEIQHEILSENRVQLLKHKLEVKQSDLQIYWC